jgi:LuxR family transcriptional regulator, glucitol operon activator
MSFSASRLTCYALISAMESDMRALIETHWPDLALDELPELVVEAAQKRRLKDRLAAAKTIGALLPHTDFADAYEIISPRRRDLPDRSCQSVEAITPGFQRLVTIRNQVAHTKPMRLDDTAFAVDEATKLVAFDPEGWATLAETMRRVDSNPAYVLGLVPAWRVDDSERTPFNNLPIPEFDETGFFGRRDELKKLQKLIKGNYPVVSILGAGGIGKTALAIQAAFDLLDDPESPFEAIVWVTAKATVLTFTEIVTIASAIKDSLGLFSEVASFLGGDTQDPIADVKSYLEAFRVLLILDNLETVLDPTLREFLSDIPVGSKVILTSRISLGMLDNPISLGPLPEDEAVNLIYALCRSRGVTQLKTVGRDQVAEFARQMSGHPSYIKWFVAGLQSGKRPEDLLGENELLLEYCMSNVYGYLNEQDRKVLTVFQVLPGSRNMAELAYLNDLGSAETEQVLLSLLTTNFVSMSSRSSAGTLDSVYFLTDFAKGYLDRQHPVARARRADILNRNQDLRDQGVKFSAEMAATPYAEGTVTIRGVDDAHVARLLKSALNAQSEADALALCAEAQKLAPHYAEAFRVEAGIRAQMLDEAGAAAAFERAISLSDSPSVRYHFANFLLDEGVEVKRALEMLQAAAKSDRESPEIAWLIAWAHYLRRDWLSSFDASRRVIDLPRATLSQREVALTLALRSTCQRVAHEFEVDRSDIALESAEEVVMMCESVGPELLVGEGCDLLRLLARSLGANESHLKGYYQQVARTLLGRIALILGADCLLPERMISSIARLVPEKGFGFVSADPKDYFLHVSQLLNKEEWESIQVGELCAFEPVLVGDGWRAGSVRLLRL